MISVKLRMFHRPLVIPLSLSSEGITELEAIVGDLREIDSFIELEVGVDA